MIEQVGPVYLNGLTVGEANERLRKVFGQIYAGVTGAEPSSEVRLTLGRLRTIQVHLLGEVATPGTYRLSSLATLFNALYRAGASPPIGSLRDIRVMRAAARWPVRISTNCCSKDGWRTASASRRAMQSSYRPTASASRSRAR